MRTADAASAAAAHVVPARPVGGATGKQERRTVGTEVEQRIGDERHARRGRHERGRKNTEEIAAALMACIVVRSLRRRRAAQGRHDHDQVENAKKTPAVRLQPT